MLWKETVVTHKVEGDALVISVTPNPDDKNDKNNKTYVLAADTAEEALEWYQAITGQAAKAPNFRGSKSVEQ